MFRREYGLSNTSMSRTTTPIEDSPEPSTPAERTDKVVNTSDLWEKVRAEKGSLRPSSPDIELQSGRTVRVFISSTFKDFYWEREALVRRVFPRLRAWCEERGIFLVECDLRWGVPKEASGEEAIISCLDEIQRSIEETDAENFFLGLLGERYGWTPTHDEVGNAIRERYSWLDGASVTLMEIIHGGVRTLSPNCLFMLRDPTFLAELPEKWINVFKEKDPDVTANMTRLRDLLSELFDAGGQVRTYPCSYGGTERDPASGKERVRVGGLDEFTQVVIDFFTAAIERGSYPGGGSVKQNQHGDEDESDQHSLTLRALTRIARGHEALLDRMTQLLTAPDPGDSDDTAPVNEDLTSFENGSTILCLRGPAGSGKSTVMARLIKKLEAMHNPLFYHFIGGTVTSKSESNLMCRLVNFFSTFTGKQDKTDSEEEDLSRWKNCFSDLPNETTYFLVIDALDELVAEDKKFKWLFYNFPPNVRCVVSCLDNESALWVALKERQMKEINMEALEESDACEIAQKFFKDFGKRMDKEQLTSLIGHTSSRNPLWLTQACEELRIHGDYSSLSIAIGELPDDIASLNKTILNRVITEDESGLAKRFLQMLFISRVGLWETEVRHMLVEDYKVDEDVPQAVWSVLYRGLKSFVHMESVPVPVIKFRHRVMKESVAAVLFEDEVQTESLHRTLAQYFESHSSGKLIKNMEYLYHMYHGNLREKLVKFMRSRPSWSLLSSTFRRSQLMMSLRCQNMAMSNQKNNVLKVCNMCASMTGYFSLYARNSTACFFCGNMLPGIESLTHDVKICSFHESQRFAKRENCFVCDRPTFGKHTPCRMCQFCSSRRDLCAFIVTERDPLFKSQKRMSRLYNFSWT